MHLHILAHHRGFKHHPILKHMLQQKLGSSLRHTHHVHHAHHAHHAHHVQHHAQHRELREHSEEGEGIRHKRVKPLRFRM